MGRGEEGRHLMVCQVDTWKLQQQIKASSSSNNSDNNSSDNKSNQSNLNASFGFPIVNTLNTESEAEKESHS